MASEDTALATGAGGGIAAREARPPFVLALDAGTSSVRASIFDSRAREVTGTTARTLRHSGTTTLHGGIERDADELVGTVVRAVDASLSRAPAEAAARIERVAVACFWHSLVGIDRDGRAVTPVYGWADTRAWAEAEALRREVDESAAHLRTGCRFHPSYWPAKILWLRKNRPDLCRAVARWVSFGEYLTSRLSGGEARASVSMASGTGLFDQHTLGWDAPLLSALSLDKEQLPALASDGETFRLADEYASRWPSLREAGVFPAVGDGAANNVGEGCTSRSSVALMVGTSAAMRVVYEGEPPRELNEGLWCYRAGRRRVVVGGALSDGGGLYEWMTASLNLDSESGANDGAHEQSDESAGPLITSSLEQRLAALEPDAHGLTLLPFWSGERSAGWNTRARGAVLGLRAETRPEEIVRASLEAVAYRLAHVARALDAYAPDAEIRASGGALRSSRLWAQTIADVLGRPLVVSGVSEASSRGAVLLALEATGAIKSVSDIPAPVGAEVEPDAARTARYARALERQQKLYELLVGDEKIARLITEG